MGPKKSNPDAVRALRATPATPTRDSTGVSRSSELCRNRLLLICLSLTAYGCLVMSFAWEGGDPFYNNDEPRHLLTSAFWADFLAERPLADPVGFAKTYYTHYPALGLIHWPPLYHLLQGAVFLVLGVSQAAARLVMTVFLILVIVGWFLLTYRTVGTAIALWSAVLFPLVPEFFGLSGHVMLEIPALAWMILSVLSFERFVRSDRARWLCGAAALAAAGALTRVHGIIVLGPLLACWLASRRWGLLKNKTFLGAIILSGALVGGYYAATLGRLSAWSSMLSAGQYPWADLGWPLVRATGPALFVLCLLGMVWVLFAVLRRKGAPWTLFGWVAATVVMWLAINYRPSRFLVYAWPALTTLGLCAVAQFACRINLRSCEQVVAAAVVVISCATLWADSKPPLGGYRDAAVAAMQLTETDRIFFQGRMDGSFVWNIRELDPDLNCTVFRASKVLSMGEDRVFGNYQALTETPEDIIRTLDRLGIDVVVTEDSPEMDTPTFRAFMEVLESNRFEELARFPIRNGRGRIVARRLTVFRFRRTMPLCARVTLPMATLGPGGQLDVDLSRPLRDWDGT